MTGERANPAQRHGKAGNWRSRRNRSWREVAGDAVAEALDLSFEEVVHSARLRGFLDRASEVKFIGWKRPSF